MKFLDAAVTGVPAPRPPLHSILRNFLPTRSFVTPLSLSFSFIHSFQINPNGKNKPSPRASFMSPPSPDSSPWGRRVARLNSATSSPSCRKR